MLNRLALTLIPVFLVGCPMEPDTPDGAADATAGSPQRSGPGGSAGGGQGGGAGGGQGGGAGGGAGGGQGGGAGGGAGGGPGGSAGGGAAAAGAGGGGKPGGDSVPVRIDVNPPDEPAPQLTQTQVLAGDHVTYAGTAACDGCSDPLALRVTPFQDPRHLQLGSPPGPVTLVSLAAPGPFEIAVPRGTDPVVLELLVDGNANGRPDRGERMAVMVGDGLMVPDRDRDGIALDASEIYGGARPGGQGGAGP